MDHEQSFQQFKELCEANGLLQDHASSPGEDVETGIQDDGALMRFFRARGYNVDNAYQQYKTTRDWRDKNDLIKLYDSIDVSHYEETRKLYTHWIGRRDRNGSPICWFEISHLTPSVMAAYSESCSSTVRDTPHTETEEMLRLFCTYENLVRFVLPLCSTIKSRPAPEKPITDTTCIVDISNVGLFQFWKLRSHMQAASSLATAHYPETLGKTYVIGAPSFFPTVWSYINKWFDQNTVSKICIVPSGQECETLSELIDPINIPRKYGGKFDFEFGMTPDLDSEIKASMDWLTKDGDEPVQDIPKGPMRWIKNEDGKRSAIAVGTEAGSLRNRPIMALRS